MPSKVAVLAASASVLLTVALSGCGGPTSTASATASASPAASASASETPSATPTTPAPTAHPSIAPIASLDGISVQGEFGKDPAIAFTAPFAIDQTRSKVLIAGTGAEVKATNYVDLNYHGVNAYTGKTFDNSWTRGKSAQLSLDQVVPGFKTGLVGKHVGDRVLVVITGKDGYDSSGGSGDGSILVGDTLVFVIDILDIDYQTPFGTPVAPKPGLPTVTTDAKGVPTVAIDTKATPPSEAVIQQLVAGGGTHKIAAGDTVMSRYRVYSWQTGQLVEDKYSGDPDVGSLNDTIACLKTGLVGQPLGSRILAVCPPATGFPDGNPVSTPTITKGDTVVVVMDLMFAAAAAA